MVQQLETVPAEAGEPAPATLAGLESTPAAALPIDALAVDAMAEALPVDALAVEAAVPASPASLWASESRAHYSITHTDQRDARAWIDCDCVIHSD